ncbi:similar to Saccharomyces cerevisiae YLR453C RIF2 Protein that binds to the Rap1p C-terminus and acts synergistically with Rif1p to help control telomere length and establish telomeric silencing [Maudiozyma saulgeensis]|uniref:Origin recognition complex subunit 4 n=1 Tax=Maudiozyma saulgeensis TaxID=1789683 RepID=A0A1X7R5M4_9SACH|nr:similar to Saccharomyces cerevisiae YLR453C RIF2 Protein that binds to the Rap1p C-terminus and acts synergistically with Rif1p to help control telomere length and establish telomeric silencing [Kazachstania saulgeensis]
MSETQNEQILDQQNGVVFGTSSAARINDNLQTPNSNKRDLEEDHLRNEKNKLTKLDAPNYNSSVTKIDPDFIDFKTRLLRHINQTLPYEETKVFSYLTETRQEVSRILKQSIIQKESHSAIMVGPRNSYKSFLINNELRYLSKEHSDQFIVVRLNGLIHSEQTAIKSIALQLELELKRLNQDELTPTDDSVDVSTGSLTEVFEKVLKLLDATKTHANKDGSVSAKVSVIFVFDEIDTFAGPVRQTLLYNLFDMVEHSVVPVCIIGTTTKLSISEFLEKRVRSRFSQRVIYVPEPNDLDDFVIATGESLSPMVPRTSDGEIVYAKKWNSIVETLLKDESSPLFLEVHKNYETFKSQTVLKNSFIPLVGECSNFEELQDAITTCKQITDYGINQYQNDITAMVQTLSDLELVILIAAARTILKSRDESTNFNITYVEYSSIIKSLNARIPSTNNLNSTTDKILDNLVKLWSKEDVKNVWETLQEFKFLTEKGAMGLRESSLAVFYASNYLIQTSTIPFDLRTYNMQVTLHDLRGIVSKSSMFYPWTQL